MLLGKGTGIPRCLAVWSAATLALLAVAAPTVPAATQGWAAARDGAALDRLPLDRALLSLAATGLLGCVLWAWLAVSSVVLEAARGADHCDATRARRPWQLPVGVRRVVLAGCGVALVGGTAPSALADTHAHPARTSVVSGLPLPDRATAPEVASPHQHRARSASPRTAVVRAGDSLWSLATHDLPAGAPAARVTARWHQIYEANRRVIGPDPDHLVPGERLRLPRKDPA